MTRTKGSKSFARMSSILEHFHSQIERVKNLNKVNLAAITAYIEL
jgi:hypothetical protein